PLGTAGRAALAAVLAAFFAAGALVAVSPAAAPVFLAAALEAAFLAGAFLAATWPSGAAPALVPPATLTAALSALLAAATVFDFLAVSSTAGEDLPVTWVIVASVGAKPPVQPRGQTSVAGQNLLIEKINMLHDRHHAIPSRQNKVILDVW